MNRIEIKNICLGRDDLLAVAEKICDESGLSGANGEVLCEELARTCMDYLNWVNEPVEEDEDEDEDEENTNEEEDDSYLVEEYGTGEVNNGDIEALAELRKKLETNN